MRNCYKKGLTTIEMIMVVSLSSFLLLGFASLLFYIFLAPKKSYSSLGEIDNARLIASQFTNEIRSAVLGADGSYVIVKADDFEIVFHSPDKTNPSTVNRVRYFISENNLYKGITKPSGSPPVYNPTFEVKKLVQTNLSLQEAIFLYYTGNYDGNLPPLSRPIDINQVRFVRINLNVVRENGGFFKISSGASIRSLKDNLGN